MPLEDDLISFEMDHRDYFRDHVPADFGKLDKKLICLIGNNVLDVQMISSLICEVGFNCIIRDNPKVLNIPQEVDLIIFIDDVDMKMVMEITRHFKNSIASHVYMGQGRQLVVGPTYKLPINTAFLQRVLDVYKEQNASIGTITRSNQVIAIGLLIKDIELFLSGEYKSLFVNRLLTLNRQLRINTGSLNIVSKELSLR